MNRIGIQFTDVTTPCKTLLDVAYTNDCARVPGLLADLKRWHDEDEHKFLGLDLEYTANGRDVAVIQLAHKNHVMVFQWSR
jgi:hypothetical protein